MFLSVFSFQVMTVGERQERFRDGETRGKVTWWIGKG
jgi:hypothetical protein